MAVAQAGGINLKLTVCDLQAMKPELPFGQVRGSINFVSKELIQKIDSDGYRLANGNYFYHIKMQ